MSIYMYTGVPGAGKSLHIASDLRHYLGMKPRPVVGNFEIAPGAPVRHPEYYKYCPNIDLTPSVLVELANEYWETHDFEEEYLALVIDECQ